jgi:hypothetical protein
MQHLTVFHSLFAFLELVTMFKISMTSSLYNRKKIKKGLLVPQIKKKKFYFQYPDLI